MFVQQSGYKIKSGVAASVTTSAAQKTGLIKGGVYAISNAGAATAYINTDNTTATVADMAIFVGETIRPILLPTGTVNHIGAGATTLNIVKIEADGT
jgi:hypothetical protein